jgi:L-alanine-DL-glutamate epimerase-like enolase superfamily enzyme
MKAQQKKAQPMKAQIQITKIEIYKADLELSEPFRTSLAEITSAQNIFVRVYASNGLYGTGETRPNPVVTGETQDIAFAAGADIARTIIGKNPLEIEQRLADLERRLVKNSGIKCAFDMALYDLFGKSAELPLYIILGGSKRPLYTDNTVSLAPADEMVEKARSYREQGFKAIKVKLGGGEREDIHRIREIRKAVGEEVDIRLDANQGWDFKTAVHILQALEQYGIQYCEQPLAYWDHTNMKRLREHTSIPIMADESLFGPHDAFTLASDGCCDYFNIKLTKAGGIHNGNKINTIAESAGIPCMIGCMTETRLSLSAAAHLMSARENIRFADLDGYRSMKHDPVIGGVEYNVGDMSLPDTPGTGADVDAEFLRQCPAHTVQ